MPDLHMPQIEQREAIATATAALERRAECTGDAPWEQWAHIAQEYGTPCYVYDADVLAQRAGELLSALASSSRLRLFFSFKANPLPSVAAVLCQQGCEAELTSPGEIAAAQEAGFDLEKALYGGPGKGEAEYRHAIRAGIHYFSVESLPSLIHLRAAATAEDSEIKILLRVNPDSPPKAKLAMTGVPSQFGFEERDLLQNGKEIAAHIGSPLRVVGIHLYWGTQIADAETLLASFEKTASLARELAEEVGFSLEIVNFGGGFAWPYAKAGGGGDFSVLREGLAALRASAVTGDAAWWFESGRYLTASSGTLLTRVMEQKVSKDERRFLILDTGIHHLGGMAGLGRIPRFAIDLLTPPSSAGAATDQGDAAITIDVVGQLCTPLDCLGKRIAMPEVVAGELLAIPNVGAYGVTASVTDFLSRPTPAEILHRQGKVLGAHRLRTGHEAVQAFPSPHPFS